MKTLVQAELKAAAEALQPFVGPVAAFASAAATLSITASVNGLRDAVIGLITIARGVYASLGV